MTLSCCAARRDGPLELIPALLTRWRGKTLGLGNDHPALPREPASAARRQEASDKARLLFLIQLPGFSTLRVPCTLLALFLAGPGTGARAGAAFLRPRPICMARTRRFSA